METLRETPSAAHAFPISASMSIIEAIQSRRAVREYLPTPVDRETIQALLQAAVAAPTAMHEEPWTFGIIQNAAMLKDLSDDIFDQLKAVPPKAPASPIPSTWINKNVDAFHGARTLIVIYSRLPGRFVTADCWLAAENLMLMARALDLGSCVIGMAVDALNDTKWRTRLGVASDCVAVAPIIIGDPAASPGTPQRNAPQIAFWAAQNGG